MFRFLAILTLGFAASAFAKVHKNEIFRTVQLRSGETIQVPLYRSGEHRPTFSNQLNITTLQINTGPLQWTQVGNLVCLFGEFLIDVTVANDAGGTSWDMDLPVPADIFGGQSQAGGAGTANFTPNGEASFSCRTNVVSNANVLQCGGRFNHTDARVYNFNLCYRIKEVP